MSYMVICHAEGIETTLLKATCLLAAPLVTYFIGRALVMIGALRPHLNLFTKVLARCHISIRTCTRDNAATSVRFNNGTLKVSLAWVSCLTEILAVVVQTGHGMRAVMVHTTFRYFGCDGLLAKHKSITLERSRAPAKFLMVASLTKSPCSTDWARAERQAPLGCIVTPFSLVTVLVLLAADTDTAHDRVTLKTRRAIASCPM